jgi:hypothetical protein
VYSLEINIFWKQVEGSLTHDTYDHRKRTMSGSVIDTDVAHQ